MEQTQAAQHNSTDHLFSSLIDTYRQTFSRFLSEIKELKEKICEAFSKEEEVKNRNIFLGVESNILKDVEIIDKSKVRKEQAEFLFKAVNYPKKVERIFRASEHNFSAAAFHQKCDNKADTLTLIRTEFGKTIGAYSHYEWKSEGGHVNDSGRRACIFSLDMMEKFVPQGDGNLIFRHKDYGPSFGCGCDIRIYDGCNNNNNSYADFPFTYNR